MHLKNIICYYACQACVEKHSRRTHFLWGIAGTLINLDKLRDIIALKQLQDSHYAYKLVSVANATSSLHVAGA